MLKNIVLAFVILIVTNPALAQRISPPSKAELAGISERGKLLASYDMAAWHATDAVLAMKPEEGITRYIARRTSGVWTVAFGRFNKKKDGFLVLYEALQGGTPQEFSVKKYESPKEEKGFYLVAAKAIETAIADFRGEQRPYNVAILPAESGQWYVYVIPAQTDMEVFPLGGDVRYLMSPDGTKIVEKRQLHKAIIEFTTPPDGKRLEAGYHTAVVDDLPEDTDVFHVMARKPSVPEYVVTSKYLYRIDTDGTIHYVMTTEEMKEKQRQ